VQRHSLHAHLRCDLWDVLRGECVLLPAHRPHFIVLSCTMSTVVMLTIHRIDPAIGGHARPVCRRPAYAKHHCVRVPGRAWPCESSPHPSTPSPSHVLHQSHTPH
jgi:hypothetical protein